jgi:cell wall-associated NlpC family hydrolase
MSWAEDYIGRPWEAGATGPAAFDCMSFAAEIQRRHFGVEMPMITIPDYNDRRALVGLLNSHAERQRWVLVGSPEPGDLVVIRSPLHLGIWLADDGGGVLHCVRGCGVIFTRDAHWHLSGLGRRQYFRFQGALCSHR